ncbi:MAG: hypothetical protein GY949_20110 [Gammaproteobacteria bacterium]|nr:hypothetical protein [Gammaproteobacteria bacterium]
MRGNSETPLADSVSQRALSFGIVGTHTDRAANKQFEGTVLTTMLWIPREHGGPGFYIGLGGAEEIEAPISDQWKLKFKLGSDQAFAVLIKGKKTSINGPSHAEGRVTIENVAAAPGDPQVFPNPTRTRIEFERLAFEGRVSSRGAGVSMSASNAALVVKNEDGDGFIGSLLPNGDTRIDFDLGLGVDTCICRSKSAAICRC